MAEPPLITIQRCVPGQDDAIRAELYNRVCAGESDFVPLTVEDIRRKNESPNEGKRHRFIASLDGVPVGLAVSYADPEWPEKRGFIDGPGVVPQHRRKGVGTALTRAIMDDLRQQGMEQAELAAPDCDATNAFCAKLGYKAVRSYSDMRRTLDGLPKEMGESSRTAIEPFEPTDEDLATLISIQHEAFKEYYNYRPWTVELLKFMVTSGLDRGLVEYFRFARIAGTPVGYAWYGYDPKENANLRRKSGFFWDLAVLKDHRNQGIAKALMLTGLAHLKFVGMEEARLSCDDMNQTGARQVYEHLGFSVVNRTLAHMKELSPAGEEKR